MHATVFCGTIQGVEGLIVEVEVDISRGIPCFTIVGLPNTAVRESRERVTSALKNAHWDFPLGRMTVNLAPANVRKEGSAFDLAIAVGILVASGQISATDVPLNKHVFLGELALDGKLRQIPGVLPVLLHARECGFARAIVPAASHEESMLVEGLEVVSCDRLIDAVVAVFGEDQIPEESGPYQIGYQEKPADHVPRLEGRDLALTVAGDMADVVGQDVVKRALLVAAAGGHHALMTGPPGSGKTMLARRFAGIMPLLSRSASLETTMIYSSVGLLGERGIMATVPLRAPHHSASDAGLIGGGAAPRPGEVTLAHNGVLFLDELPEFRRHVLETLREPLEDGRITISRARNAVTFPARFQLLAAMNPCPCGFHGSPLRQCRCSPMQIEKYIGKISGPLLDRIAVHVSVRAVDPDALRNPGPGESSETIRIRVEQARSRQRHRLLDAGGFATNALIPESLLREFCAMTDKAEELLFAALRRLTISARGRSHIIRVARTIADLAGDEVIDVNHMAEAIQYRTRHSQ